MLAQIWFDKLSRDFFDKTIVNKEIDVRACECRVVRKINRGGACVGVWVSEIPSPAPCSYILGYFEGWVPFQFHVST